MGFGWAGAAAGASDALAEMLTKKRAEFLQNEQLKSQQAASDRAERQLQASLSAQQEQSARSRRDQQLQEAGIALGQADAMGQGAELSPDVAALMRGTPYGARVEQKETLPSRSLAMPVDASGRLTTTPQSDPGGRSYATLKPIAAQMRETGDRTQLNELLSALSPDARNLATLERQGIRGLNIHDVEGADQHQAHVTREHREAEERARRIAGHQHGLAVSRDDRNAARADARASQFTQADLLSLTREANTRAVAEYNALVNGNDGYAPTDAEGNPITPSQLAQQYVDEALAAIEAFNETSSPSNGRRAVSISELRKRVTGQQPRSVVALTPRQGRGTGAGPGPMASGRVTVQTPQGPFIFPNQQAADEFRRAAGVR